MSARAVSVTLACVLMLSGCSAEDPGSKVYAEAACTSIIGNYNTWKILSDEINAGEPGRVAASNFDETLNSIFSNSVSMFEYSGLLDANKNIQEDQSTFSAIEKLAGIVTFKNYSENLLAGDKWKPGNHVTLDGMFDSLVIKRCEGVDASSQGESPDKSLASYSSKNDLFDAFISAGGQCGSRLEDTNWRDVCKSSGGVFQGSVWWNDDPLDSVPAASTDVYIIYGVNWEVWISKEIGQDASGIAKSLGGTVIAPVS